MNKMLLPTVEGGALSSTSRTIHWKKHRDVYSKDLAKKMDDVHTQGIRENWPTSRYREELEKIISTTRQKLKNGEIELNKHTRESLGLPMKGDK